MCRDFLLTSWFIIAAVWWVCFAITDMERGLMFSGRTNSLVYNYDSLKMVDRA